MRQVHKNQGKVKPGVVGARIRLWVELTPPSGYVLLFKYLTLPKPQDSGRRDDTSNHGIQVHTLGVATWWGGGLSQGRPLPWK